MNNRLYKNASVERGLALRAIKFQKDRDRKVSNEVLGRQLYRLQAAEDAGLVYRLSNLCLVGIEVPPSTARVIAAAGAGAVFASIFSGDKTRLDPGVVVQHSTVEQSRLERLDSRLCRVTDNAWIEGSALRNVLVRTSAIRRVSFDGGSCDDSAINSSRLEGVRVSGGTELGRVFAVDAQLSRCKAIGERGLIMADLAIEGRQDFEDGHTYVRDYVEKIPDRVDMSFLAR